MATGLHADQVGDEVHTPYIRIFADAAARAADAGPYTAADLNKKAIQSDTVQEYVLTAVTPTWTATAGGGGGGGNVLTGNEIWVDDVNGDDVTGTSGRFDLPFLTIGAALTAASSGDSVFVRPGSYAESITVPSGVSLIGDGGPERVTVTGGGGATPSVDIGGGAYIHSIGATAPSGSSGFRFAGGSLAYAYNLMVTGTDATSVGLDFSSAAKIIVTEFRYIGGTFDSLIDANATGILALTGLHIPGGGTLNNGIKAAGGARLQLNDINSGNPTLTDAIECADATIVMRSSALFNCSVGLHVTSNSANCQWQSVRFDSISTFEVLVDPGLTGASGTLNLLGCELEESGISIPASWLASDHNWTFQDQKSSIDDSSWRCFTDLTVGHHEKGYRTDLGAGCPSARGMKVVTSDAATSPTTDGGTLTDVSATAQSKDSSTFTYQGVSAGHAVYFGSSLQDVSGTLKTYGVELAVTTARVGGTVVAEIWDGAAWVDIGAMDTSATPLYGVDGPAVSTTTGRRQVRLGIISSTTWARKTIATFNLYWFRLRLDTVATTAPIYEQAKLHPSCTRVNEDGFLEFYGNARRRRRQLVHHLLSDALNGASGKNQDMFYSTEIELDQKKNKLESSAVDGFGEVVQISEEIDTSLPATFRWGWIPSSTNTGDVEFQIDYMFFLEGTVLDGSIVATQEQKLVPGPGTTDELVYTDFEIDISEAVAGESYMVFSFRRNGPSGADTFSGNVEGSFCQLTAYEWQG